MKFLEGGGFNDGVSTNGAIRSVVSGVGLLASSRNHDDSPSYYVFNRARIAATIGQKVGGRQASIIWARSRARPRES